MPRFDANLSLLFTEIDFLDRFAAAAAAGFSGVEYMSPYGYEPGLLARRLADNGLSQVLFNLPAGDWDAGERGLAILPDRVAEFRSGVETAVTYAKALDCRQVNCLAGVVPVGANLETLRQTLIENLKFAADLFEKADVKLLIEPINPIDMPGFYLNSSRQALDLIDAVGSDNLFLQYDVYHMQIVEGDLARTIEAALPRIAHVQIADNPGRHEPGTGEINYRFLFDHLDKIGYAGWIGCEYRPSAATVDSFGWMRGRRQITPARQNP